MKSQFIDTDRVLKEIRQKRGNAKLIYDPKKTVDHIQPTQASFAMPNHHHNAEDNPGYTGRSPPKTTAHTHIQMPQQAIGRNQIHVRALTAHFHQ